MLAYRYVVVLGINCAIAMINIGSGAAQVPNDLNPSPNPLQLPSRPQDVRIQRTQPITLQQALELARRNNTDLQEGLFQIELSRAALREVEADIFPSITLNGDITRSQSAGSQLSFERVQANQNIDLGQDQPSTSFGSNVELTYGLYNYRQGGNSRRAAEEQVIVNELDLERLSEETRLNVTNDYYDLQQADEQVRIERSAVENAQASLRDAQAREQAGVGTRYDVLQSQVNLADAQQDLTNAISQQQIDRRQLANRLNLGQSVNITAADPVKIAGLWNLPLEQTIILAYQNRPELQQRLAQRNNAEYQRRRALSQLKPQASLVAKYELEDTFNDRLHISDGYSLAVQGQQTLFDGGVAKAQADQQSVQRRIYETQFASQLDSIRFEIEQAYSQLQANLNNIQTTDIAINQARESLRLARLRFQAGVGTQTDVISAQNDLTRAEGNRVTAILDYNRALAQLQRSVTSRGLR